MSLSRLTLITTPLTQPKRYAHFFSSENRANLFVRQPLTQTDPEEKQKIQHFMDWLVKKPVHLLLGKEAKSDNDFRPEFEKLTGLEFNPENFRNYRLKLLRKRTDGFVFYWGNGLSVSGGFEVGYIHHLMQTTHKEIPLFFAEATPIKTTLLRNLPHAHYHQFERLEELDKPFENFLEAVSLVKEKAEKNHLSTYKQVSNR